MKDFDIAKYLKEHQLGSYGILNHYVDLKPLKEEDDTTEVELNTEIPYEGPEDKLTGLGDGDSFEQDEIVSEEEQLEGRLEGLINRRDLNDLRTAAQMIFDDLTADGFEAEDVAEYLMDQIKRAAVPYLQNATTTMYEEGEMEEEWYPHDEESLEKGRAKIIKKK